MRASPYCLIFLLACTAAATAQVRPKAVGSIRLHGTMAMEEAEPLSLAVFKGSDHRIRAAIFDETKIAQITLLYSGGHLLIDERTPGGRVRREAEGEEAAANLLDLIALNPDFHFENPESRAILESPVLDGFSIRLARKEEAFADTGIFLPDHLKLFRDSGATAELIRSVYFDSFMGSLKPFPQPRKLRLVDELTGETGRIEVLSVEYNPGLPDFLFELPEEEAPD
jgi:hypothetical protein